MTSGTITMVPASKVGAISNSGTNTAGAVQATTSGTLTFNSASILQPPISNSGTISVTTSSTIVNSDNVDVALSSRSGVALNFAERTDYISAGEITSMIDSSGGTITNSGTISSTNSGVPIEVANASTGAITNSGTIVSTNSSAIDLIGGVISNTGTLTNTGVIGSGSNEVPITVTTFDGGVITNSGTISSSPSPDTVSFTSGSAVDVIEFDDTIIDGVIAVPTSVLGPINISYPDTIWNTGTISSSTSTPIEIYPPMDATIYNFGIISNQGSTNPAVEYNGGYGEIINGGTIEGGVIAGGQYENDYVLVIGENETFQTISDQGFNINLATGDAFGLLKSDTNIVSGNVGSQENDIIQADDLGQTIVGQGGDDWILANGGDDTIYAGIGDDFISGGDGDDLLFSGEGDDFIAGGQGDDILIGSQGDDMLIGGNGSDILFGGSGNDVFLFNEMDSVENSSDLIMDFEQGSDQISLVNNVDSFDGLSIFKHNGNTVIFSSDLDNEFVLYLKGEYDLQEQDFII
jgi:Ca2+-binding RTX toxin-like protein